jgi:thiol-disulfide isomerase/thioredoxin
MNLKKTLLIVAAAGLAACGKPTEPAAPAVRAARPGIGSPAPAIVLNSIISGDLKALSGWEQLRGRAVVLEFWATWCDPCVQNIAHLNELAEKFKGKPVAFISVTQESRGKVESFLKDREMRGNIAADGDPAFSVFRVRGIPYTVLIDKEGVVRDITYPARVTEQRVNDLLAGRPLPPQ